MSACGEVISGTTRGLHDARPVLVLRGDDPRRVVTGQSELARSRRGKDRPDVLVGGEHSHNALPAAASHGVFQEAEHVERYELQATWKREQIVTDEHELVQVVVPGQSELTKVPSVRKQDRHLHARHG